MVGDFFDRENSIHCLCLVGSFRGCLLSFYFLSADSDACHKDWDPEFFLIIFLFF